MAAVFSRTAGADKAEVMPRNPRMPGNGATGPKLGQWLSPREKTVAVLLADAHPNKEIAARLGLSPGTVAVYTSRMYIKAGAKNRVDFAAWWKAHVNPDERCQSCILFALHVLDGSDKNRD